MNNIKNIVISVLVVIALIFAVLYFTKPVVLSGITHYQKESFLQGLDVGTGQQFSVSNAGVLTSSGANTLSGASAISGVSTFTNTISNTAATSTLGCLRIYQVGATTVASTTYYLVASSTLNASNFYPLFATSTKPAYCN